jgi:hypothetical protein
VIRASFKSLGRLTRDKSFQYGLELVLDGVAARLPTPAP